MDTRAAIIGIIAAFATATAHAGEGVRLEALGGHCKVSIIGSGIWFQREYPHAIDTTSGCWQVSISEVWKRRGAWGYGLRLGYVDLGTTRMDSEFAVLDEEQHLVPDGSACNPATFSGCKARGWSAQRIHGISIGALSEHRSGVGFEAGAFVYSGSFDVTIDVHGAASQTWVLHWQGEYLSPYLGVTFRREHMLLLARVYTAIRTGMHDCGGCSGFTKGPAGMVSLGVSF